MGILDMNVAKVHKNMDKNCLKRQFLQRIAGDMQNLAGRADFIDAWLAAVV